MGTTGLGWSSVMHDAGLYVWVERRLFTSIPGVQCSSQASLDVLDQAVPYTLCSPRKGSCGPNPIMSIFLAMLKGHQHSLRPAKGTGEVEALWRGWWLMFVYNSSAGADLGTALRAGGAKKIWGFSFCAWEGSNFPEVVFPDPKIQFWQGRKATRGIFAG